MFATAEADQVYTIAGLMDKLNPLAGMPAIHGHRASPPRPRCDNLPPPGLFRWHYLQCVLKRFAHNDYQDLANIYFPELTLRMKGDSDNEGTDNELEWPSMALDFGREMENRKVEDEGRHQAVAQWVSETL